ncbi:MAG: DUF1570 domain-containing protein [Planctomycetes bacterium]|nr:DUF1570 domain-containing protein [Planctomycetota bacterium]
MRSCFRKLLGPAFFAIFLALPGCLESGSEAPFSGGLEVAEYFTDHYQVRVVGSGLGEKSREAARNAGLMLEKIFDIYAGMEEIPLPPGGPMPFWLHFNRREYDRQAALYDFPANTTNGFCTTAGEVHVYFRKSGRVPPEATVIHEGFHQYCHRALHYPTPPEVFQRVPGYKLAKLPTVPLWLNEGMAMNMESGRVERDHNGLVVEIADVGSVNRERLTHLAQLINSNRCPSVRTILNLIMGEQISADDYAAMWGIVFDFRMATGNAIFEREQREIERAGPDAVRAAIDAAIDPYRPYPYLRWPVPVTGRFLRASRVVWGLDVPALVDICAAGAREPRDFDRQWNRRLTQAALSEVEKLLRDHGESLEQWEAGWKKRMLTLYAEVRGGTYQYVEPKGIGQYKRSQPQKRW